MKELTIALLALVLLACGPSDEYLRYEECLLADTKAEWDALGCEGVWVP